MMRSTGEETRRALLCRIATPERAGVSDYPADAVLSEENQNIFESGVGDQRTD
jgi:hypothetical protein